MQGYYTTKGMALSAKLLTGTVLTITRVAAGSGNTGNPLTATALPQLKQTLAVNIPTRSGNTATIPVTLAAALAEESYTLMELGVYARDPEEGEILYKIYKLTEPVDITAGSRMVLRFYLEETVSEDMDVTVICSPAGLITETDFAPVRNAVEAISAPNITVSLSASDLQSYLDALPRLLTKCITIKVSGTADTELAISGFYGCGAITIQGADVLTLNNKILIQDCRVAVDLFNISAQAPDGFDSNSELLDIRNCSRVWVENCSFTGNDICIAVYARLCSFAVFSNCAVNHAKTVVMAATSSIVTLIRSTASDFSDNTCGVYTYRGGTVILGSSEIPDLLGGVSNVKSGGPIFKYDGTSL